MILKRARIIILFFKKKREEIIIINIQYYVDKHNRARVKTNLHNLSVQVDIIIY